MEWISIGLLILSGGCVLYRYPPNSVIQLLLGYHVPRKERSLPSHPAEKTPPDGDLKQKPPFNEKSPSISIGIIEPEEGNAPAYDLIPSAVPDTSTRASADSSSKPASTRNPPTLKPPTFSSMPPPPRPSINVPLRPPPSAAASLRVPATKTLSSAAFAPSRLNAAPAKRSRQVTLAPGHSPLDWAALTADPNHKLRGNDVLSDKLIRVPPSQLKHQNGRKGRDAWTVYQGMVYNVTPYLPFHPGGEAELLRGAGRDAVKLFMEVHPWVNWEAMLGECLVGVLVAEGEDQHSHSKGAGELDEMD